MTFFQNKIHPETTKDHLNADVVVAMLVVGIAMSAVVYIFFYLSLVMLLSQKCTNLTKTKSVIIKLPLTVFFKPGSLKILVFVLK